MGVQRFVTAAGGACFLAPRLLASVRAVEWGCDWWPVHRRCVRGAPLLSGPRPTRHTHYGSEREFAVARLGRLWSQLRFGIRGWKRAYAPALACDLRSISW